jgi:hypothetical protein
VGRARATRMPRESKRAEAAILARHANPRVTLAVYAGLTDGARELAVDKLLSAGFGA